jgi:predicted nucleic acid-binding protein
MAKNNPVKIIFDTNWFISYIITGRPEILDRILIDDDYEIILSDKQEEEFEKVITYPKHRRYFTVDIAKRYFGFIKQRSL